MAFICMVQGAALSGLEAKVPSRAFLARLDAELAKRRVRALLRGRAHYTVQSTGGDGEERLEHRAWPKLRS
eukprot:9356911-Lingulodinium_polyedra.AAC.1